MKPKNCICLLCFLLSSCAEEEIDFQIEKQDIPYEIVVQGGVFSINDNQLLTITKAETAVSTTEMPVSGANVEVSDGNTVYRYHETDELGKYESIDKFAGEVGKVYTLKIKYNGKNYFASDTMTKVEPITIDEIPMEKVYWKKVKRQGEELQYISYELSDHVFGYDAPSIWVFPNIFYGFSDSIVDPGHIQYWDKCYLHKGSLPQGIYPAIGNQLDATRRITDTALFIKTSVSNNYYKYIVSVYNNTNWSSSLFSTIPDNVCTNLSKGATGYFYASDVSVFMCQYKDLAERIQ